MAALVGLAIAGADHAIKKRKAKKEAREAETLQGQQQLQQQQALQARHDAQQQQRQSRDQYFEMSKEQMAEQERRRVSGDPMSPNPIGSSSSGGYTHPATLVDVPPPPPYSKEPPGSENRRMTFLERQAGEGSSNVEERRPSSEYYGPVSPISPEQGSSSQSGSSSARY